MSLGPLMVDIPGLELTPEDREVLSHPLVGSVLLFSRNYRDRQQVAALTAQIRALRSPSLLIAVDHEGGRVQRFREGFTRLPPARLLGRRFEEDRRDALGIARTLGWLLARELRDVGVDFSFTPCIDLDYGVSEVIGDRAFHRDPDVVGALAVATMSGLRDAGFAAVAKHFPGHGAVVADSHTALPVDRREFVDLEQDLRPYRIMIDNQLPAVMAAHVVFPAVDELPASLSRRWLSDLLRRSLGFHGCIFADDLSMAGAAVGGDVLERAHLSLAAGCDVLPLCNDRGAVERLLGRLHIDLVNPASQARLVRMRARGEISGPREQDPAWPAAVARIAALGAAPPLVLTERPS
jgi:beta-N-acetylhexosaminidase